MIAGRDSPQRRPIVDLLIALSLANLCFLYIWRELLFADGADLYWIPDYTSQTYQAILINVIVLGAGLYGVITYLSHSQVRWRAVLGRLVFIAFFIFPLNYLRIVLGINDSTIVWLQDHWWISLPTILACSAFAFYLLLFRLKEVVRVLAVLCLIMSPFAFMTLAQALWSAIELSSDQRVSIQRSIPEHHPTQRVLWLVMDELDLRLAFLERPEWLALPAFDRLRNQALFATDTVSHSLNTKEAIPSFLLQEIVKHAEPTGSAELRLTFEDFEHAETVNITGVPNVFSEAQALGATTAVVGAYHPYCRLFGDQMNYCRNYAITSYTPVATSNLGQEIWSQISGTTPLLRRANAIRIHRESKKQIRALAADPRYDLIYMHAMVPHGPNIWNSETNRFTVLNISRTGYFDNLILADTLLRDIRSSMEQAGLWDDTAVLVTSDHEWRYAKLYDDRRTPKLPFLLKMPGQNVPLEYDETFAPMRVTKDLILAIMAGRLSTASGAADWLRRRSVQIASN
ncbi:MAG: sulfatase-like hydrolase/transferase [Hyphomicrobiales bacterium]|nr:sulfatase-like hydrolase/transferase [Hyphomicrobiales bacterium]